MRLATLLLLTGCASPLPASLAWSPLPDLVAPELPAPVDPAVALIVGDPAPGDVLAYPIGDALALEARSEAFGLVVEALAVERAGREADRAWASAVYSEAREACRRRSRAACAVCAALAGVGSAAVVGGGAAAACR